LPSAQGVCDNLDRQHRCRALRLPSHSPPASTTLSGNTQTRALQLVPRHPHPLQEPLPRCPGAEHRDHLGRGRPGRRGGGRLRPCAARRAAGRHGPQLLRVQAGTPGRRRAGQPGCVLSAQGRSQGRVTGAGHRGGTDALQRRRRRGAPISQPLRPPLPHRLCSAGRPAVAACRWASALHRPQRVGLHDDSPADAGAQPRSTVRALGVAGARVLISPAS
jgi:hypothetical protein